MPKKVAVVDDAKEVLAVISEMPEDLGCFAASEVLVKGANGRKPKVIP